MLLQKKIEKRKRRRFQIGPATPGEVSGTKKRDNFLEKNPVKTVENYCFHWLLIAGRGARFTARHARIGPDTGERRGAASARMELCCG